MGACEFTQKGKGVSAEAAFGDAVAEARYMNGHGGYSGTLAEKHDFVVIPTPPEVVDLASADDYAYQLIDEGDPRIDDKWGPAGCLKYGPEEYLFFGWASS